MRRLYSTALLGFAACLAPAQPLHAQGEPPAKIDVKACMKAAKVVDHGHPAKKQGAAFLTLSGCGSVGAQALASAMLSYARETDIQALDDFMTQLDSWRDSTIMAAATTLANDGAASTAARVYAVRYLNQLTHRVLRYSYSGLVRGYISTADSAGLEVTHIGCQEWAVSDPGDLVGQPLPADYVARVQATLAALIALPSVPDSVKHAASCGTA